MGLVFTLTTVLRLQRVKGKGNQVQELRIKRLCIGSDKKWSISINSFKVHQLEEGWAPKNWCFWTVVLEKTLESPLDCKEIQPAHSEGDQPWDFFGRNDAKAETPVLWPPHAKSWLIGKDSDAGRDWEQEEKGTTEDEMAGWHHWLNGRESQWTPGVGDGQGGLVCCDSWGLKESDTTERLIWSEGTGWTGWIYCRCEKRRVKMFNLNNWLEWYLLRWKQLETRNLGRDIGS